MPKPLDTTLYESVKKEADAKFDKPSAYKSGWIVKTYKDRGGTYSGAKPKTGLTRWYKERWQDVAGLDYPVYRPTKRISKDTPLLPSEIDPKNLRQQARLKQKYKGDKNLPPFLRKGGFHGRDFAISTVVIGVLELARRIYRNRDAIRRVIERTGDNIVNAVRAVIPEARVAPVMDIENAIQEIENNEVVPFEETMEGNGRLLPKRFC